MLERRDVPDALFATDNSLGIPRLDLRLQADCVHLPVMTWGATKRNQVMPGTWHFYVDDYRFRALWDDPTPVVNSRCIAACEPNYTTSEQMATAVGHYRIYQKRWLARWWQTQGLRIFVDLNVAPEFYWANMQGVPAGWRAYMTRGYSERLEYTDIEYALAVERAESDDILFAVYGGGERVQQHCWERGYTWIPETADMRKGKVFHG